MRRRKPLQHLPLDRQHALAVRSRNRHRLQNDARHACVLNPLLGRRRRLRAVEEAPVGRLVHHQRVQVPVRHDHDRLVLFHTGQRRQAIPQVQRAAPRLRERLAAMPLPPARLASLRLRKREGGELRLHLFNRPPRDRKEAILLAGRLASLQLHAVGAFRHRGRRLRGALRQRLRAVETAALVEVAVDADSHFRRRVALLHRALDGAGGAHCAVEVGRDDERQVFAVLLGDPRADPFSLLVAAFGQRRVGVALRFETFAVRAHLGG
mmetsp:Transcript_31630/g.97758  ORF Transcript_31630/g.97758 Transcript_31630/m.97758 type:complete len:266 (-) Transcript_31630:266-1063(-)